MDPKKINEAVVACYDAVIDHASWPDALHQLARSFDAVCCMFYPQQAGEALRWMPASRDFNDFLEEFVRDGWSQVDYRATRGWPFVKAGRSVVLEHDIANDEDRRTHPLYNELLRRYGLPWWAALSFTVSNRLWCLPIQRAAGPGPFTPEDAKLLETVIPHLRRMVSLSEKLTLDRIATTLNILDCIHVPAFSLDWLGRVIRMNRGGEALLGSGISLASGWLHAMDRESDAKLQRLLAAAITPKAADPSSSLAAIAARSVSIRRWDRRPLVVEAVPAAGLFADVLHQARALVLVTDLEARTPPPPERLAAVLGVTPAEARLMSRLVSGDRLADAAWALGISEQTARNHLKAIFAKTDTHRQAELIALLARVASGPPVGR
ncbi:helix-turn-helix transcriptional regulator [Mesorhizobium sp.]|uniref:helix-turn-helix transcriptional regulator n=1 Tax=Mesorhizobium sp. TaxID=1871066 RepID=UPI00122AF817|nr:helix-turn-helix transcriptional regulator [Mesorhizobium sp.]TIS49135.1 MAG: helix-turn-helix transcriptional regulator [Mesorhizobium sp.]